MNCLWCDKEIIPELSWSNLVFLSKPKQLCQQCESKLEFVTGKRCDKCSRISGETLCHDCKWWEHHTNNHDPLTFNYSIFHYNDQMQALISRWKYRGDYCLGYAFKDYYQNVFKRSFAFLPKEAIAVPIPLSSKRFSERGFNQAQLLATFLPIKAMEVLTRIHGEKQSKKTRQERLSAINPFYLKETVNKPVILVDDIYTTGSTLRHAAKVLKEQGCPNVYAFTLVRG